MCPVSGQGVHKLENFALPLINFAHWQGEFAVWLQAVDPADQCRLDLDASIQQLLGSFAGPILEQVSQQDATAAGSKYNSAVYSVSQDAFLYDHVKVTFLSI